MMTVKEVLIGASSMILGAVAGAVIVWGPYLLYLKITGKF